MMNWKLSLIVLLTVCAMTPTPTASAQDAPRTIRFSGYEWMVREQGVSGPGPNQWDPNNVWVDKAGDLHLKITRVKGATKDEWRCAELYSKEKFGFGRYEFQTAGRVDRLDPNVVLGLFDYFVYGEDSPSTNEIDIEFARWGNPKWPNGNFTVYPATGSAEKNNSHTFEYALPDSTPGMIATHRFTRASDRVTWETFAGTGKAGSKSLANWVYAPAETRLIPQKPLRIHVNLWLFQGRAPADGKTVEVVVKKFTFTPE
ncbi:MAG: glycoside hydrolase family 16 protein [Akkermansiaceae bacterium]|nr:glycoside hydrolase family 16 protein [Armatimonadota bacterium]